MTQKGTGITNSKEIKILKPPEDWWKKVVSHVEISALK